MSTNFYLHEGGKVTHIGTASGGWCFALHVIPERGLVDLNAWIKRWNAMTPGEYIADEYGRRLSPQEMLQIITVRSWLRPPPPHFDYEINCAVPGPNNLVRARVDGQHCIGHGEGTYDYIIGDFS